MGEESACKAGDASSIPGPVRSPGIAMLSSILAWRIPMDRGACGLQTTGSQRIGHDWGDGAHTREKRQERNYKSFFYLTFLTPQSLRSFITSSSSLSRWDFIYSLLGSCWTSLVAQMVKCLPTMRETWVRFLGRKGLLEKEMAPHSSTLDGKIPWTEEPGRLQFMGSQRVGHDWATSFWFLPGLSKAV